MTKTDLRGYSTHRLAAALEAVIAYAADCAPPGQCLYDDDGDDGVDCESCCDCGWGTLWYQTVLTEIRNALEGKPRERVQAD